MAGPAGRRTFISFNKVLTSFPFACNGTIESLYSNIVKLRLIRTLARNIGKKKTLPEDEVLTKISPDDVSRISAKRKSRKEFLPFQFEIPEVINSDNQYDCLAQVVTPLCGMPYHEQLELKGRWAKHVLLNLQDELRMQGSKHFDIARVLHEVIPSPTIEKYRNKDEFCVHLGIDGNPKTVGFYVGSPSRGNFTCVRSNQLINMRDSHKRLAQLFEQYISSSPVRACHHFKDGGHWRNLIVRSNLAGDHMAIVVIHPQSMGPHDLNEVTESLARFFSEGDGSEVKPSSLYFQACPHTRCTHDQAPFQLLLGKPFLEEECLGRKFRLSPDSFFQVNTLAAEVLYETVLQLADPTFMSTLLDVCCGTGTLATIASPVVRGVIGIESVYSAVRDARANAASNGCSNIEIIPGLAEKKLPKIIDELSLASDIVAVVNPGRSGVDGKVISALRECKQIDRLVYVSCHASGPAMKNFAQLCAPREGTGRKWPRGGVPFSLTRAVPVDMFPHTTHCELLLQFHRRL